MSGQGVGEVYEYEITLTAYNGNGEKADPETYKIWNFPGMSVNYANPAEEISTPERFAELAGTGPGKGTGTGDTSKKYVLVENITLAADWVPVGTAASNFLGRFYGAGRTITVSGNPANVAYTGLFGYAENAEIRDLELVYSGTISAGSNAMYTGGIVGCAAGSTKILNCGVKGGKLEATNGAASHLGGIAAYLDNSAYIENCRAALNITLTSNVNRKLYAGGVVGFSVSTGTLKDIDCTAAVELANTYTGTMTADNNSYLGGIAGQCTVTSLDNCVFSGGLRVPGTDKAKTTMYAGGLVGYFGATSLSKSPEIKNSRAGGTLDYLSGKAGGESYIGGLAGYMNGGSGANHAKMIASRYEGRITGDESGANGAASLYGGIVGQITLNCSFEACYAGSAAVVSVSKAGTGYLYLGGFTGRMSATGLSGAYSEAALAIVNAPLVNLICLGGLAGDVASFSSGNFTVERCYAKGNLSANSNGNPLYIGGLVGSASHGSTASTDYTITFSRCYAAAKIRALNTTGSIKAGGLIGTGTNINVEYCYALGDVIATRSGASAGEDVYAAGLIGYLANKHDEYYSSNVSISECFAKGLVVANLANGSDKVWGGGLIGYADDADGKTGITAGNKTIAINKAAALGAKVTVTGGSAQNPKRVLGGRSNSTDVTLQNAYANNAMLLGTGAYDANPPGSTAASDTGLTALNGKDTGLYTSFMTPSFWQTAAPTSIGFSSTYWNFSAAAGNGYPTLKELGGQ